MAEKEISRREFLRFLGVSTAAVVPLPELSVDESDGYSEEVIHGIKVYGGENPIKSKEKLQGLLASLERMSFLELHLTSGQRRQEPIIDRSLLPENTRFWEFVIPKSTYDKFEENEEGVNFLEWATLHVERTNEMLASAKPEIPIRVSLKRILVLDDSLYPSEHPFWKVEHDNDNFSRWAKDVDSRWAFNPNYYDYLYKDIDYYKELLESYGSEREIPIHGWNSVTETSEGKIAILDWGLVHELIHHFDVGDLYWPPERLPENKFGHLPARFRYFSFFSNDIMGGDGGTRSGKISPLTAYVINMRAEEGHRGRQPDGKRAENPYLMFPKEARISFEGRNSELFERLGEEAIKIDNVSAVISEKDMYEANPESINGNSIRVNEEMSVVGWYNWYLIIEGRYEGKEFSLPFPKDIFNLSSWQGEENPRYKINLTGNDNELAYRLSIKTIYKDELNEEDKTLFAWAKIPSTDAYLVWEWIV